MAPKRNPLQPLRRRIDRLDGALVRLLGARAALVHQVGDLKRTRGLVFYDPDRAREVVARAVKRARRFPAPALKNIYSEITNASLLLEQPLRIAYLGPAATFTHLAALKRFGPAAEYLPQQTTRDVFLEVEGGRAECGLVPVENSTEGVVNHTLDLLLTSDLLICGEVLLPVTQNLVGRLRSLSEVRTVYSHPQGLAQGREWLEKHLPRAKLRELTSTAAAAQRAAQEPGAAAVASELAARLYGLRVLAPNIGGPGENITRFLVLGKEPALPSRRAKVSVAFSLPDRAGALFHALQPLAAGKVNMTRIESRPTKRRAWEYVFFVDLEGSEREPKVRRALARLRTQCTFFRVLGSYPREE